MLLMGDKRHKTYLFAFIDDMSRLIAHAESYLSESLATYLQALRQALLKRGGCHASSISTTAQPSAPTTWKRSPPPWASPWPIHHPTCLRTGAKSKDFLSLIVEFDEFPQWCGNEVDHGHEDRDITVDFGSCPGGLEDAVKPFQAGVGLVGGPAA
ncbi:hypothetical protein DFAR_810008 [Desulfarculales bacterium]